MQYKIDIKANMAEGAAYFEDADGEARQIDRKDVASFQVTATGIEAAK